MPAPARGSAGPGLPPRGPGYGEAVEYRGRGPARAAALGARAALVRSITSRSLRSPHTGSTRFADGQRPIPAAAVSIEDAELIARLAAAGPVKVKLRLSGRMLPDEPSANVGGSFSLVVVAADLTYWTDLDDAGSASQIRLGGRVTPPVIPLYGRLALGLPLDGDTRDVLGTDIIIGAGFEAFVLPVFSLNLELDYHKWTEGSDFHPLELKVGAIIGF